MNSGPLATYMLGGSVQHEQPFHRVDDLLRGDAALDADGVILPREFVEHGEHT